MALLEILKYPHPVLRQQTEPIREFDAELRELIENMAETMYDAPGVGLAAPQVGVSKQLVVIDVSPKDADRELIVLINPEISEGEGDAVEEEGCLSVVDLSAKVSRFTNIKVKAHNAKGEPVEFSANDWFARVIQHEIDHLHGTLFIDHLSRLKRALYKKKRKKQLMSVADK